MAQENSFTMPHINPKSLILRMAAGAAIGFGIISIFVFGVDTPNPDWGESWQIRPLIVTPLAGAFGILVFYSTAFIRPKSQWLNVLLIVLSAFAFVIALWLGVVLGLAGTMWN
jgi:hypothetical protein